MVRDDLSLVRRAYAAFARRDLAAVLDTLDPAIVWRVPEGTPLIGGVHRGHDAVADMLCAFPSDPDAFRCEPDEVLPARDRVMVLGHHRAPNRARPESTDLEIPFVHVWTLRDGAAVGFDGYSDSRRLADAFAQPEKSGVVR